MRPAFVVRGRQRPPLTVHGVQGKTAAVLCVRRKDAKMKTYKTRIDKRDTYTYIDANGRQYTLKPGDVDEKTGYVLTEEDIARLHRFDDSEVYNNVKNSRAPIQDWEKPFLDEWKKAHPDQKLPTRVHISIEYTEENDEGQTEDADKGIIAKASIAAAKTEDPMIERLREVVEMMRPDQRELYIRVVINEESMCDVADEMGVDPSAIRHRMATIRSFIRKNF